MTDTPAMPEILDACCGGRMWWWDKAHPRAVYMDVRSAGRGSHSTRPHWECEPDIKGDFRAMPFADQTFRLVLFDPPHLTRRDADRAATPTGNTLVCYGVLHAASEQDDLRAGFSECWRVLAPGGTLIFKWAGKLSRVAPHFPAAPIVGTRTLRSGSGLGTRWFVFYKPLSAIAALAAGPAVTEAEQA